MKARSWSDDVPEPEPGFGQVLVQVQACGICGSDLHFAKHGGEDARPRRADARACRPWARSRRRSTSSHDVFMGHEFAAEVLEVGKDTESLAPGTLVTSIPMLLSMTGDRPDRLQQHDAGRLRRADAPVGPAPARGAERARSAPRRADRADGRRPPRGEPVEHRAGRGRARARLRPGRHRGDRRAEAEGRRVHRRRRLLAGPSRARRRRWARTEVVDPAVEPSFDAWYRVGAGGARGVRGDRRAGDHRRRAARRTGAAPASSSSACAWSPTRSRRSSASARS